MPGLAEAKIVVRTAKHTPASRRSLLVRLICHVFAGRISPPGFDSSGDSLGKSDLSSV